MQQPTATTMMTVKETATTGITSAAAAVLTERTKVTTCGLILSSFKCHLKNNKT